MNIGRAHFIRLAKVATLAVFLAVPAWADPPESSDSRSERATLKLDEIKPTPEFPVRTEPDSDATPDPRALRLYRKGERRFADELWSDAIETLEKAVDADPSYVEARILLARASMQLGNLHVAERQLKAVVARRPRSGVVHQLRGEIAWIRGKPLAAITALRLALSAQSTNDRSPERALAHLTLARALQGEGYLDAAAVQLQAYLDLTESPTDAMTRHRELSRNMAVFKSQAPTLLGDILSQLERHDAAAQAYRQAAAVEPESRELLNRLALSLARAGKLDEAVQVVRTRLVGRNADDPTFSLLEEICRLAGKPDRYDFEIETLAKETGDARLTLRLARRLLGRGRVQQARQILQEAASGLPLSGRSLLVVLHARCGDSDRALQSLLELIRSNPDFGGFDETISLLDRTQRANFEAAARQAVEAAANDAHARLGLGWILAASGRPSEALPHFESAAKASKALQPSAAVASAAACVALKRWSDAIEQADAAIALGAPGASAYLSKALAHDALDENPAAEKAFMEAFGRDRDSPRPLYHLALSLQRRSGERRAEQLYRQILSDVDPGFAPARERLFHLYLNKGLVRNARSLMSGFVDANSSVAKRLNAMLDYASSPDRGKREEIRRYQDALRRVIAAHPDDGSNHLELANSYNALDEFSEGLASTQQALAINADDISARTLQASLHAKLLQFEAAAAEIERLLKDRPRDAGYLQKLLEYAENRGDTDTAVGLLRTLSNREDLADQRATFKTQLIAALVAAERYDEALGVSAAWLKESETDAFRRKVHLSVLAAAGRHDEGVALARGYYKADPTSRALQVQLVTQLGSAERYGEAQRLVLSFLEDAPQDVDLNDLLIQLCWAALQWDDAIEIARANAERTENQFHYQEMLGQSFVGARRFDDAVEYYRDRANALQTVIAYQALVQVLIEAERFTEAEQVVNRLLRPELAKREAGRQHNALLIIDMRNFLTAIYQETDRASQAIQQLEAIYEIHPTDPGINNNLGYTWADAGQNLDRAEEMIRYALSQDPRSHASLDSLGWVLYKKGRFEEAAYYLHLARRKSDQSDPVVCDHLGDALYRLGKLEQARDYWKKALELCGPNRNPPPNRERRALGKVVEQKLKDLDENKTVRTAEVVVTAPERE